MFGPRCVVVTTHHGRKKGSFRHAQGKRAPIHIGKGSWLGAYAVLTPGTTIGNGCLIGANTVVSGTVPDGHLVKNAAPQTIPLPPQPS
ncbi:DapH/DapD/GlmU-related protein [Novipirellula rosea]|uniref:DapH/DapD/GlmU-related protein n=1 Tax=Novipirellula rosea TaxID=1031540 RepID=UPI003CD0A778